MKLKNLGIYNLAIMALLFSFSAKADDMDDVQALLDAYIETCLLYTSPSPRDRG